MSHVRPLVAFAALLLAAGCTSPSSPASEPSPPPRADDQTSVPVEPSRHRIGIRTIDGEAEFYDRVTGERWVPRGFNHWRWTLTGGHLMDGTFRAGENSLDAAKADLAAIADLGYNAVRIWASACFDAATGCMGDPAGGVRDEYLQNMADYLRAAKSYGLVVASPSKAFDLSEQTWWSSGADAPQWIEVDLGGMTVERVRLMTRQATEGPMQVTVRLLAADGSVLDSHTFTQTSPTAEPELVLEHTFVPTATSVAHVRVETERPGWVIWYEIGVFGSA